MAMTIDPTSDALQQRAGLPVAFRYLEAAYPRAQWPTLNLHPTAAHWLEIHAWFRAGMTDLTGIGTHWREGRIDAATYRAAAAPRLRQLLTNLHHHHGIESQHYFPQLAAAEPRMAAGFALLDRDHAAIDPLLADLAQAANALIRAPGRAEAAALADRFSSSAALLDRHLSDEEEIVVPVLTLRGDSAED
jgi:iron-sulfur cluster repair protein YtfE (RIC family)